MKILWIFLLLTVFGCEKFDHSNLLVPNCSLCDYAESIEGLYRGSVGGFSVTNNPNVPSPSYNGDSMTMNVQQIFLNQSAYIDSTKMYFVTEYWYDIDLIHKFDTIEILSDDGYVEHNAYLEYSSSALPQESYYWINNDTISIRGTLYNPAMSSNVNIYGALLLKQ